MSKIKLGEFSALLKMQKRNFKKVSSIKKIFKPHDILTIFTTRDSLIFINKQKEFLRFLPSNVSKIEIDSDHNLLDVNLEMIRDTIIGFINCK